MLHDLYVGIGMSRYVAYVVQPDGVFRYTVLGRLTDSQDKATRYYHPSAARRAASDYVRKHVGNFVTGIIDTRDPERIVP